MIARSALLTVVICGLATEVARTQTTSTGWGEADVRRVPHLPKVLDLTRPAERAPRLAQQIETLPPLRPQEPPVEPPRTADELPPVETPDPSRPFAPEQVRLPLLGGARPIGSTPRPTQETIEEFRRFVAGTIDPENTLDLVVGRPRILVLRQTPRRVQIADENVARVTVITDTELSVDGMDVGTTVLNIWFGEPGNEQVLSYLVRVIPDPELKDRLERVYEALADEINRAFPESVVRLSLVGDKVVVSGQAKDIIEAAQILRVVSANAPGGGRDQIAIEEIPVQSINLVTATDEFGELPAQGLQNFLLRDIGRNVINLLEVPGEQQVMLRVTVAEVNRAAARSIGVDFTIMNDAGTPVFASLTGGLLPTTVTGSSTSTTVVGGNIPVNIDNGQVFLVIQALRNLNLARSLAEPTLTTLNGQPAQFRAGGEFPVPAATQSFGGVGQSVAFVPFGVQVRFIPYITDRDRIRLQVGASVSTRDPALGTNVGGSPLAGGTSVSGLNSRTFQTTVELREGQTLAVAGLIQNNFGANSIRVPLIGDWPIVGNFFARNSTSSAEQELVILVTPELVHPLEACETPPLPGADVFEPGDVELYLLGRLESRRAEDFRSSARTDHERLKQYRECQDRFITGPYGQTYGCCPNGERGACAIETSTEIVNSTQSNASKSNALESNMIEPLPSAAQPLDAAPQPQAEIPPDPTPIPNVQDN
jgi:pilus assembly protein CpaC